MIDAHTCEDMTFIYCRACDYKGSYRKETQLRADTAKIHLILTNNDDDVALDPGKSKA